jgi:hypothetical protein
MGPTERVEGAELPLERDDPRDEIGSWEPPPPDQRRAPPARPKPPSSRPRAPRVTAAEWQAATRGFKR